MSKPDYELPDTSVLRALPLRASARYLLAVIWRRSAARASASATPASAPA